MTVWVIYEKLDEGYGAPFKVFRNEHDARVWCLNNKDMWGLEYCCEEIECQ